MLNRLLLPGDRAAIESLCGRTPELDLVMLANLDRLSGDQNLVQYWGQFDDSGRLAGVLMRYHALWYIHGEADADLSAMAQLIEIRGQPRIVLNGSPRKIEALASLLAGYRVELRLPARLRTRRAGHRPPPRGVERLGAPAVGAPSLGTPSVRQATLDDVERLAVFYAGAPEDVRRGADSLRRSVAGGRRTFLVEDQGEVMACALTTAELPNLAMVGGLHAAAIDRAGENLLLALGALVQSLEAEGKDACVVTRDPRIDDVCDQLSFSDTGPWLILHLQRRGTRN